MVILHTCWRDEKICVWGEQDAFASSDCLDKVQNAETKRSPYDPGEGVLRDRLSQIVPVVENGNLTCVMLRIDLPTRETKAGFEPYPSLDFLNAEEPDRERCNKNLLLRPWEVTAVALKWKQAVSFFAHVKEKRIAPEVFAAEDTLRFGELFRYAGALVARGRFLPVLWKVSDACFEARWLPCKDAAENRRQLQLASRLPLSALCGRLPIETVHAFLGEMVDRLVRVSVVTTLSRAQAERGKYYSVHDAWFSALRGETRLVRWDSLGDLTALYKSLYAWRRPVEGSGANSEQLLIGLEEPAEPSKPWFLHLCFGTKEQTETRLDGDGNAEKMRLGENLLIELGQAAMLFPPMGSADFYKEGLGCYLSTQEAHTFMTASSALLAAAGFDIQLPGWWQKGVAHVLSLAADASPHLSKEEGTHSLDEKMDIQWSVLLNGEPITSEEMESLLRSQSPLVHFRGQWILIDPRQIQEALRMRQSKAGGTQSALDIVRLALGTDTRHYGLEVSLVRGCGWMGGLLKRLCGGEQTFEIANVPETFHGTLRPYQVRGFSWLVFLRTWGFGACLADDMGLGKTIQALVFLLHEKQRGEKRPVLLVGPMSVLGNWMHEAQHFAPDLRCFLHHGTQRPHGKVFAQEARQADLVITSYHLLYRDYTDLRKVEWAGILLDEAQNIKNPDTHQAQAARALQADYRMALTGTPMENHVGDVWSIMDFLNPGLLGRRSVFREKFYLPIQSGTDVGARSRLRRVTAPFILRRLKTDKQVIADLPEKVENKVYCSLTLEQANLYREVLDAFHREVEQSEGATRRGLILAVLTRLKQVCNHPANYLKQTQQLAHRSGKLIRLEEMLEEAFERGESALIFTQYAEMGALLKHHLCRTFARDMPFLCGRVPRKARDTMVREFQESTQPLAFVLSLKAGGTGLNLTRATHVFHYDRWWNPAVENQATDRAFRIGQTRNVMVHKFICSGTLEERIDAMIENKTALANEIVTSGEKFLTELSNSELNEVLRLEETQEAWRDGTDEE